MANAFLEGVYMLGGAGGQTLNSGLLEAFGVVTLSCTAFFFPIASAWRGERCRGDGLLLYFSLVLITPPEADRGARRGAGGAGGREDVLVTFLVLFS